MLSNLFKGALLSFALLEVSENSLIQKEFSTLSDQKVQPTQIINIDQTSNCRQWEFFDDQKGRCVSMCSTMKCYPGSFCKDGQCIKIKRENYCKINKDCNKEQRCEQGICRPGCSLIRCIRGTQCLHGQCIPVIKYEDSLETSQTKQIECKDPRPNEQTCPTLYYFRAPDLSSCIIDQDGKSKGYARECEICKDKSVLAYTQTKCRKTAPII